MSSIIEIPYRPREAFKAFHGSNKRWSVVVAHRRSGKSVAAINHLVRSALMKKGNYAYIGPTYIQTKRIAWQYVKDYCREIPGTSFNEAELKVTFVTGSFLYLLGSENPDSLRGLALDGVVFDEYQLQPPHIFGEIIRPALADRGGYAVFIGTILGKNLLFQTYDKHKDDPEWFSMYLRASESGILPQAELDDAKKIMTEAQYAQEFELEPYASIEGAIFGKEMAWLRAEGHLEPLEMEELADVDTYWDLGIADYLVVLFMQRVGREHRIIDCYYTNNTSLAEVVKVLSQKGYSYGTHYLPHDAKQRESITGMSREDFLKGKLQGNIHVVPRVAKIEDAIMAVKLHYKKLWINESLETLVEALYHYSMEYDDERKVWKNIPKHDWTSHFVSALEGWAMVETTRIHSEVVPSSYDTPIFIDQTHYAPDDVRL